ncbi:MAG: hypothetical protein AB1345_04070 [Chloroflexota bacterium]
MQEVNPKWADIVDDMVEIPLTPYKKDVLIDLFGVAWRPDYLAEAEGHILEFPGFSIT